MSVLESVNLHIVEDTEVLQHLIDAAKTVLLVGSEASSDCRFAASKFLADMFRGKLPTVPQHKA